jgi:hypothetical protein
MKSQVRQHNGDNAELTQEEGSLRCCCGNLLARLVAEGVELKCRRCKRRVIVPLQGKRGETIAI